jgi:hypothetical protein
MKLSTDRILTTHVGSLPRSQTVVDFLFKREHEEPHDRNEFERVMNAAVSEIVRQQVETGIDVVSDGETSKSGYATYIKDRLTGFSGDNPRQIALDLQDYPDFRARMAVLTGKQGFKRQSCTGPVEYAGHADLKADIEHMKAAIVRYPHCEGFLNAASPGVVSAFQPDSYYKATRPMWKRSVMQCKSNTKSSSMPDSCCNWTVPIWRWPATPAFRISRNRISANAPSIKLGGELRAAHSYAEDISVGATTKPSRSGYSARKSEHRSESAAAIQFEASNPRHAHE